MRTFFFLTAYAHTAYASKRGDYIPDCDISDTCYWVDDMKYTKDTSPSCLVDEDCSGDRYCLDSMGLNENGDMFGGRGCWEHKYCTGTGAQLLWGK